MELQAYEKEHSDMNWFKGKQEKHVKEMEMGRKRSKLGKFTSYQYTNHAHYHNLVLTTSQRKIFDQVKAFVLERRKLSASQQPSRPPLTMPNTFPARDRQFINRLADDLHLSITWDEYDDEDQNLVTWRFPGELEEPLPEEAKPATEGEGEGDEDPVSAQSIVKLCKL